MLRKTLLLIYLLLSSVSYTLAQDIRNSFYYSPHINEGLSQLSVRVIHQDSRGYIWLGTKNGLNRYNGKEYTVYQENPSDSLSLTNSDILSLAEEPGHALWIGTSYGLNRLCQHTNRIRRYLDDKGILRDAIQSVFVDRSGRVWVGNRRGIFLYHREEDRFYPVEIAGDGGSVSVSVIFEDSSGKFWIGTHDDGVYVCDQQMQEGIMDSQADSLDIANGGTEMSESITVAPAAPPASAPGVSAPEDFARQKYKILLVEDDKDVREYLHKSLENDYDIIEASNGMRGYEKAVSHFPDLVLSDIMMPKRNGLELCSMIKNDVRIGHIPVILMTARSMVMHIKEGFSAGADDYIIKPFNMDVLRLRIRSLLESRAQLKKLYGKRFSPDEMGIEVVSADERFSQKLFEVIEKNISDQNLGVEMLCQEIGISRANLYRKLKSITELSPTELIRNKRLEIAAKMLKESDMSVSEVAALLGFNSHSYFSNSFKSFYGYTPTEFIQKKQAGI